MVLLTSFAPPTEGVHLQQTNTRVDIDGQNLGNGTLFISESCVVWLKEEEDGKPGKGFSLEFPAISCHAISRDQAAFPEHCLYVMIDGKLPGDESTSEDEDDEDDDIHQDSDADVTEIRFIPADKNMVEPMFAAMSDCQALHPDPEDMDSDNEMYTNFQDGEEEEEYTENGMSAGAEGASSSMAEPHSELSHFADVLHLGQGDGPGTSEVQTSPMTAAGDAWQADDELGMDLGQFHDAEDME